MTGAPEAPQQPEDVRQPKKPETADKKAVVDAADNNVNTAGEKTDAANKKVDEVGEIKGEIPAEEQKQIEASAMKSLQGVDFSKMTETQKNNKIANVKMSYGVDVSEDGKTVIPPTTRLEHFFNRVSGLIMMLGSFKKKESTSTAPAAAPNTAANTPAQKPGENKPEGAEDPVDPKLRKELEKKTITQIEDQVKKDLDGPAVAPEQTAKEKVSTAQTNKRTADTALATSKDALKNAETASAAEPENEGLKKEVQKAQADVTLKVAAVQNADAEVKTADQKLNELNEKKKQIDAAKKAVDGNVQNLNKTIKKLNEKLSDSALKDLPQAEKLIDALGSISPYVSQNLEVRAVDKSFVKVLAEIGEKAGIDKASFETEGDTIKNPVALNAALTKLIESFDKPDAESTLTKKTDAQKRKSLNEGTTALERGNPSEFQRQPNNPNIWRINIGFNPLVRAVWAKFDDAKGSWVVAREEGLTPIRPIIPPEGKWQSVDTFTNTNAEYTNILNQLKAANKTA